MSDSLWFAEGFTNYYGVLALKRAGLESLDRFDRSMGGAASAVITAPGCNVFDVIDMSRQVPFVDAAVSNDPVNYANTFISYQAYGQAIALGVDLEIRARFPGKSLDDWMRQMLREHPDANKPYTLQDLQSTLVVATVGREFRGDLSPAYLRQRGDGLRKAAGPGRLPAGETDGRPQDLLGAQGVYWTDAGMDITSPTLKDSPLYIAGLERGDRVAELDGKSPKTQRELDALLDEGQPGDSVHQSGIARRQEGSGRGADRASRVADDALRAGRTRAHGRNVEVPRGVALFESHPSAAQAGEVLSGVQADAPVRI